MGWLSSIRERFAASSPKQQDVIARMLPFWQSARPLPLPHDYRAFSEDGFRRNTVIFACITEISTSASEAPLRAMRAQAREEPIDLPSTDPMAQLVARPNPTQSQYELLSTLITHLHVAGNAYLHKVRARDGKPIQLWPLRPDRVRIQPDRMGMVAQYAFQVNGQPILLPAADVIHLTMHPDPLDDYYGLSPVAVLARFGDLDNSATDFLRAFFLNAGVPGGLLTFKAGRIGKEERDRVRQLWVDQYSGVQGWHAPGVIDADVDYKELGKDPRRLDLSTVWGVTESRIASVFGVPPILVGLWIGLEHATFANYQEARKSLWEETLIPLHRRISDKLTHGLAIEFGADRLIDFDRSGIEALQETQDLRDLRAMKAWDSGLITMNQANLELGYPETPDGEVRKLPVGTVLVQVNGAGTQARQAREALTRPHPKALQSPLFVDDVPNDPFYLAVHKIADRLTPKMRDAFLRGVLAMNGAIDELALIAAVETGNFDLAMAAIPFEPFAEALKENGGEILLQAIAEMGVMAANTLKDTHGLTIAFDLTNPRAQQFAATQTATMVTEVTEQTQEAVRAIIGRAFSEGLPPREAAKEIQEIVGLHSRQAKAVANFRDRLIADGVEGDLLEKRVEKYAAAQLRQRAETIARTELLSASNSGQSEAWLQAQEKGLLPLDQKRSWLVTPDDRLCDLCEPMDGVEVGLNEPWDTPAGAVMNPPMGMHPSCRCSEALLITRS